MRTAPLLCTCLLLACEGPGDEPTGSLPGAPATAPSPSSAAAPPPLLSVSSVGSAPSAPPPANTACPADMALVEGGYCLVPAQICSHQPTVLGTKTKHHCQRYQEPARCLRDRREPMRFCMDRYEWPNEKGAMPRTLTTWGQAGQFCSGVGKRLCTEDEFIFACEGESMKPHVYGFERSGTICNADRPYIERTFAYTQWDECLADEKCKAEFDRLDQRVPAGSKPQCVSDHGVYDINGNVNEWVTRRNSPHPYRGGLKGGWWGPVRNRCRPMTTDHPEGYWGYEVGFRCCRDANPR